MTDSSVLVPEVPPTADPTAADLTAADLTAAEWAAPSWDEVVRTHSARVYRLAYRLTGNAHDAEDLTQDVFVRVFRSLSSYTPGVTPFHTWLPDEPAEREQRAALAKVMAGEDVSLATK